MQTLRQTTRLLRFMNDMNSDYDIRQDFSFVSTFNHRPKATKQLEEEPKVLRDVNLTVRNKAPEK